MSWAGLLESAWEGWKEVEAFANTAEQIYNAGKEMSGGSAGPIRPIEHPNARHMGRGVENQGAKRPRASVAEPDPSFRAVRRRIEPIEDAPEDNNPPSANMAGRNVTSTRGHQDEVQVMPHAGPLSKIVEDYHTINLSYWEYKKITTTSDPNNTFYDSQYRLNSIYDVNETESGLQVPLGRDTWASIYQYYRVLACDFEVKIIQRSANDAIVAGLVLEEDNAVLTTNVQNFMMRKNAIRTVLPGSAYVSNSVGQLNYHYNPATWDHHVQESGIEERWTPIGEQPSNLHRVFLRFARARYDYPNDGAGNVVDFEVMVRMKFTVQFREANKTILTTNNPV